MLLEKRPPLRDPKFLEHQRTQPCLVCGQSAHDGLSVVAAHIGTAGRGVKSSDAETIPLCTICHDECHQHGEMTTLSKRIELGTQREFLRAWAREQHKEWKDGK